MLADTGVSLFTETKYEIQIRTLKELSDSIQYGYTQSSAAKPVGPKFLRITDIQNNKVNWDKTPYCEISEAEYDKYMLFDGDIVIARTGATTGKSFLIQSPPPSVFASYLIRVKPDKRTVLPEYLWAFMQSNQYWKQITVSSNGSTQPGVNASVLSTLKVPVPPMRIQSKIAEALKEVDAVIEKRKQAIAQLDKLVQSVFADMFGEDNGETRKLSELCNQITDGTHHTPTYVSEGVPFISVKNVTSGKINFNDCRYISAEEHGKLIKRCKPEFGDIVYTKIGTYGIPAIVDVHTEFSLFVSVALIKEKRDLLHPVYLREALRSPKVKRQADKSIKGIGVPDLHLVEIRNFAIAVPPMAVQSEFAQRVERIEDAKAAMQQQLAKLEESRQSLLQRAFSGLLELQ